VGGVSEANGPGNILVMCRCGRCLRSQTFSTCWLPFQQRLGCLKTVQHDGGDTERITTDGQQAFTVGPIRRSHSERKNQGPKIVPLDGHNSPDPCVHRNSCLAVRGGYRGLVQGEERISHWL